MEEDEREQELLDRCELSGGGVDCESLAFDVDAVVDEAGKSGGERHEVRSAALLCHERYPGAVFGNVGHSRGKRLNFRVWNLID